MEGMEGKYSGIIIRWRERKGNVDGSLLDGRKGWELYKQNYWMEGKEGKCSSIIIRLRERKGNVDG